MSRKPDGTERSGRGTAPPAAGGFGGADTALVRLARPFVPKPFRSTGGMSTSADTMMSIGMGRHNNDDELPEDQVNIAGIVDRKVSDRRYLPRKLGNMKYYLHTTPINESLKFDDDTLLKQSMLYEKDLNEFLDSLSTGLSNVGSVITRAADVADPALQVAAAFIPFGDIYYGYRAYRNYSDIKAQVDKIQEILKKSGTDVDFTASPDENADKIKNMIIPSPTDRAMIKDAVMKIAIESYNFLVNIITAIPLEIIPGLSTADTAIDISISALSSGEALIDPEGEKLSKLLIDFSNQFSKRIKEIEDKILKAGKSVGLSEETLEKAFFLSNFIGNLSLVYNKITEDLKAAEGEEEPDVLAELRRRKKKKKKKTDEISTTGAVAGYTGPLAGPRNPKQFYDTMARVAGSEYLIDPAKTLKAKP